MPPMAPEDEPTVLGLIDEDSLPGQHPARALLTPVDESVQGAETLVVCDPQGEVAGVVRCQVRAADGRT